MCDRCLHTIQSFHVIKILHGQTCQTKIAMFLTLYIAYGISVMRALFEYYTIFLFDDTTMENLGKLIKD